MFIGTIIISKQNPCLFQETYHNPVSDYKIYGI